MVKAELLRRKLEALQNNLDILNRLQRYEVQEFINDPERYGSAERFLQLSIEILDDIGSHIISDESIGVIDTYSDIPRMLFGKSYISEQSRESWLMMIGFRNLLVHGYAKIDRAVVHRILKEDLSDIEQLAKEFSKLL